MLLDGRELTVSEALPPSPSFSPDGRHVAVGVKRRGRWVMTRDGREVGAEFANPCARRMAIELDARFCGPIFSPNGTRIAYVAAGKRGRDPSGARLMEITEATDSSVDALATSVAVRQGPPFDVLLSRPLFDEDGRLAYTAWRKGTGWRAGATGSVLEVLDDRILTRPVPSRPNVDLPMSRIFGGNRTWGPVYSGDGRHVAYLVQTASGLEELVDGVGIRRTVMPNDWGVEAPTVSHDGKHLAYVCYDKTRWRLMRDGEVALEAEHPRNEHEFGSPWPLLLSADGAHLAFAQGRGRGDRLVGMRAVLDGRPGPDLRLVQGLLLTPDGEHLAYVAGGEKRFGLPRVVLDDRSSGSYSHVYKETMAFEGSRLRFVGVKDGRHVRVVVGPVPASGGAPGRARE